MELVSLVFAFQRVRFARDLDRVFVSWGGGVLNTQALQKSNMKASAEFFWVLLDYCKKNPCNFNTEMLMSEVGNPCPTLGSWSTSGQPDFVRALGRRKQHEIAGARFCTQSCSKVGQLLINSAPAFLAIGSCRGLPCSSPLATPNSWRNICVNSSGCFA